MNISWKSEGLYDKMFKFLWDYSLRLLQFIMAAEIFLLTQWQNIGQSNW